MSIVLWVKCLSPQNTFGVLGVVHFSMFLFVSILYVKHFEQHFLYERCYTNKVDYYYFCCIRNLSCISCKHNCSKVKLITLLHNVP